MYPNVASDRVLNAHSTGCCDFSISLLISNASDELTVTQCEAVIVTRSKISALCFFRANIQTN